MNADLINFFINGSVNGAYFSLIALGFSLVYGVGGILNLSHGGFYLLTGYLAYIFIPLFIGMEWLSIICSLIIIMLIGAFTYIFLIKPMEKTPTGILLITFGLAFFIGELARVMFGLVPTTINLISISEIIPMIPPVFPITAEISISSQSILIIVASIIILGVFAVIIKKTSFGNSIRAVSQDREAASLMGINTKLILMYTVLIASLLAGLAAILYLPTAPFQPHEGFYVLTDALTIVILGGMGSMVGSVVGAYIIGYSITFTNIFIPNGTYIAHLIPVVLIVIILIIRPYGLFGKKEIK